MRPETGYNLAKIKAGLCMSGKPNKPEKYSVLDHAVSILSESKLEKLASDLRDMGSSTPLEFINFNERFDNSKRRRDAEKLASAIVSLHETNKNLITEQNIMFLFRLEPKNRCGMIAKVLGALDSKMANQASFEFLCTYLGLTSRLAESPMLGISSDDLGLLIRHLQHPRNKSRVSEINKLGKTSTDQTIIETLFRLYITEEERNNQDNDVKCAAIMLSQGSRGTNNNSPIRKLNSHTIMIIAAMFSEFKDAEQKAIACINDEKLKQRSTSPIRLDIQSAAEIVAMLNAAGVEQKALPCLLATEEKALPKKTREEMAQIHEARLRKNGVLGNNIQQSAVDDDKPSSPTQQVYATLSDQVSIFKPFQNNIYRPAFKRRGVPSSTPQVVAPPPPRPKL